MICLRKLPHLKIYSIFAFLFFSFFFASGISQDSYATSSNCTYTASNLSGNRSGMSLNTCSTPSFTIEYVKIDYNLTWTRSSSGGTSATIYFGAYNHSNTAYTQDLPVLYFTMANSSNAGTTYNFTGSNIYSVTSWGNYWGLYTSSYGTFSSISFEITFSDDISDLVEAPDCPVCEVCPAVPDNPYDNKFDAITKAIYTCGAVLIMLYFFFCIYKIIVKDGGSR